MSALHTHPDAAELLDAAIAYLAETLTAVVPPEQAFHLRVTVNALRMVRRELLAGAADDEAHRARLATLGVRDDAELAAALRAGPLRPEARAALLADAEARLRVANPGFVAEYEDQYSA